MAKSNSGGSSSGNSEEAEKHSDPRIRDKKSLPLSDNLQTLPLFAAFVGVVTPAYLLLLLPLTALTQLVGGLTTFLLPKAIGKAEAKHAVVEDPKVLVQGIQKKASDSEGRIYDIVLFGATGFTGKLAAIYIAKQYKDSNLRWAIAGRRLSALKAIQAELAQYDKKCATLPIILADSFDEKSLDDLTSQTKVVITTAGPFDKYGSSLVKSCVCKCYTSLPCLLSWPDNAFLYVVHGTHYCDITGETDWVRKMIDQYDDVARVSGSRIVHFCGHDCVPWDLATLDCAKALLKKGEHLTEISVYDEVNTGPSGGTIATVFHILNHRERVKTLLGFDPLLKTISGEKATSRFVAANPLFLGYSKEHGGCFTTPFPMAMVMANCVRRSHVLNQYSDKLIYREAAVQPSFMAAYVQYVGLLIFGTALFFPPLRFLLQKILPEPGQGPSEKDMDAGYLHITAYGRGDGGSRVKATFYFPTDPGYRDTGRMLVESGLVLALEGEKVKVGGGVWTPAACQGELLRDRLLATGSALTVEVN
eukprot:scaffold3825_cov179-Ochromonas_danica.AAC.5